MTSQRPIMLHCYDTPVRAAIVCRHIARSMPAIGIWVGDKELWFYPGIGLLDSPLLSLPRTFFSSTGPHCPAITFLLHLVLRTLFSSHPLASVTDAKLIKPAVPPVHPCWWKFQRQENWGNGTTYRWLCEKARYCKRYPQLRLVKNEVPFDSVMNTLVRLEIDRSYLYSLARGGTVSFYAGRVMYFHGITRFIFLSRTLRRSLFYLHVLFARCSPTSSVQRIRTRVVNRYDR